MKKIVRRSARIVAVFILCLFVWLSAAHTLAGRAPQQDKQKTKGARDAPTLYAKTCATCHGKDGRAKTFKAKFNKARDLTDVAWQKEASDERLFNSITNGRGKMPSFGRKFSESEINELVAFVRQLKK